MRIGVLASHEGTTLQAIIDACTVRALAAKVVAVISNNRDAGALHRARAAGIRVHHLSSRTHSEAEALDAAICQALVEDDVDVWGTRSGRFRTGRVRTDDAPCARSFR